MLEARDDSAVKECVDCTASINMTALDTHHDLATAFANIVVDKLASPRCHIIDKALYSVSDVEKDESGYFAEYAVNILDIESKRFPFASILGLKECLDQGEYIMLQHSENITRHIIPLSAIQSSEEFVVLDIEPGGQPDISDLSNIISVYCNCRKHLYEKGYDALTGLSSRKTLNDQLPRLMSSLASKRRGHDDETRFFFAFLDLDFFKRINDDYGHLYGDEVLLTFGRLMRKFFRVDDLLYRYGGEEFCVLLKAESSDQALKVLERFRVTVEEYEFAHSIYLTVSIGLSELKCGDIPTKVVDRADKAVYFSKQNGRNQTSCYQTVLEAGLLSEKSDYQEMGVELFGED